MRGTRDLPLKFQLALKLDLDLATDAIFEIPYAGEDDVPTLVRLFRTWLENRGAADLAGGDRPLVTRILDDAHVTMATTDLRGGLVQLDLAKYEDHRASLEFWIEWDVWPRVNIIYFEPSTHDLKKHVEDMGTPHGSEIVVSDVVRRAMMIRP